MSCLLENEIVKKAHSKNSNLKMERITMPGYEQVFKVTNAKEHLTGFIAIHSTILGPSLGGIRIYPYISEQEAFQDVLRLSKGMTYKAAIGGLGLGGGKGVIIASQKDKTIELLQAFGEAIDLLGGAYISAEDLGCSTQDVLEVRKVTKYVVGLPHEKSSGDPGIYTAWGTLRGIQSVLKKIYGSDSLENKIIAMQGLGNVGFPLLEHLYWAGAKLIVQDINEDKVMKAVKQFKATSVTQDEIMKVRCDIFSPCARGAILNRDSIPHLNCKGIAGCANNQLLSDQDADLLKARNILYAPDFVINAGGLFNVSIELEETGYNPQAARDKVHKIYDSLLAIYEIAEKNNSSTHKAAISLAEYRLRYGIGKREKPVCLHHCNN